MRKKHLFTHKRQHAGSHPVIPPQSHASCMVCGTADSLGLQFRTSDGSTVAATFQADPQWQGYSGVLHGGMICTLLDAAMTHCLFRQGIEAVTASLKVRFLAPVPCTGRLDIRARLAEQRRHVYFLDAEIASSGRIFARAESSFIRRNMSAKSCAAPESAGAGPASG